MTIKEDKVLNQWLDEQLRAELIVESSLQYVVPCFYIPKERWITIIGTGLQKIEPKYDKGQNTTILNWGSN